MIFVIGVTSFFVVGFCLLWAYFKEFNKLLFVSVIPVLSVVVGVSIKISIDCLNGDEGEELNTGVPIVLWWTAFSHRPSEIRKCANSFCFFTENRSFRHVLEPKAFLFYGSNLNVTDLPVPRNSEIWALLHEESVKNAPVLLSERFVTLFNFTSTFDRNSDLPLTTQHLTNLDAIIDPKFFVPTATKNKLLESIAPVVYIQSNCDTVVDRDAYVANLSRYLKIDSFGKCLNNAELPENLNSLESLWSDEFLNFLSRYKFQIAIENVACNDYITEKLWRTLTIGVVPLYFGSPSIRDWLPNNKSAIFINDFDSPQDLANFVKELNEQDDLYDQYLIHKTARKIDNEMLKNIMKSRLWSGYGSLIEKFECDVCLVHYESNKINKIRQNHLKCEVPISMLTNDKNESNFWNAVFAKDHCRGNVIHDFVTRNVDFNTQTLEEQMQRLMHNDDC